MPEETILRCDAPGCDEIGEYCSITIDGKTSEVILGQKHLVALTEIAGWGKPARGVLRVNTGRSKRRGTDEARLLRLLNADQSVDGRA